MLCDGTHPLFDVALPEGVLGDAGDLLLPNTSRSSRHARGARDRRCCRWCTNHHMVWLGGDHSVTLSLLRAYMRHLGRPLAVVHFDAHCDTWTDHFGEPSGHGTWVYEAMAGRPGGQRPASPSSASARRASALHAQYVADQGGQIFTARNLRGLDSRQRNWRRCCRPSPAVSGGPW
jgi:agmatinase